MKNIFLSIALVALFSLDILAQVPRVISYQGVLNLYRITNGTSCQRNI